jgi:hypothetical protein
VQAELLRARISELLIPDDMRQHTDTLLRAIAAKI